MAATRDAIRPKTPLSLPTPPSSSSSSSSDGNDPQIPAETSDPLTDTELTREPKRRRRNCLRGVALEKVEELLIAPQNSNTNNNFSFTFDTEDLASAPEITPKFGSFNFAVSTSSDKLEKEEKVEQGIDRETSEIDNGFSKKATTEEEEEKEEEEKNE